jgi:hypothetical protein
VNSLEPEKTSLADRIESAILGVLKGHLLAIPDREEARAIIRREADNLAAIALVRGGPIHPFRHVGARRTRMELRRIIRANGRPERLRVAVEQLHATAIQLLGDSDWTRGDLLAQPRRSAVAAQDALDLMSAGAVVEEADMKPRNLKAIGMTKVLIHLFERVTLRQATWNEAGPFLSMLGSVHETMPANWGNLESLARTAINERRRNLRGNLHASARRLPNGASCGRGSSRTP